MYYKTFRTSGRPTRYYVRNMDLLLHTIRVTFVVTNVSQLLPHLCSFPEASFVLSSSIRASASASLVNSASSLSSLSSALSFDANSASTVDSSSEIPLWRALRWLKNKKELSGTI